MSETQNPSHAPTLKSETRKLFRLGMPLVGSAVAGFALYMTDTLMVGQYNLLSLGTMAVATNVMFVLFVLGSGFGGVIIGMVAEAHEQGDAQRVRRITRMAMWLSVLAALLPIPFFIDGEWVFLLLRQPPEVAREAASYTAIVVWGLVPQALVHAMRGFLSGLERTSVQLWVTIAAIVINALVNYLLIFGAFGFPELGIRGAAIASIITQSVMFVALAIYAQRRFPDLDLFTRFWRPDWPVMWQVFRLGLPVGFISFFEVSIFTASTIMMGWIGQVAQSAHSIALQITSLTFMFHLGMSSAATVRLGRYYGAGSFQGAKVSAKAAYIVAYGFAFFVMALFILMPEPLILPFIERDATPELRDEVITLTVSLMVMAAIFQLADATQIVAQFCLRGLQDTAVPMWIALVSFWGLGIPLSYVLAFPMGYGPEGLWGGLTIGLTACGLLLSWRFWRHAIYKVGRGTAQN